MQAWMNWGGTIPPRITGNATDKDHPNWIVLVSIEFVMPSKPSGTGSTQPPVFSGIVVSKQQDSSSADLFRVASGNGGVPETILLDVKNLDAPQNRLSMKLSDAAILSFQILRGMESITLAYSKLEWGGPLITPHTTMPPAAYRGGLIITTKGQ